MKKLIKKQKSSDSPESIFLKILEGKKNFEEKKQRDFKRERDAIRKDLEAKKRLVKEQAARIKSLTRDIDLAADKILGIEEIIDEVKKTGTHRRICEECIKRIPIKDLIENTERGACEKCEKKKRMAALKR